MYNKQNHDLLPGVLSFPFLSFPFLSFPFLSFRSGAVSCHRRDDGTQVHTQFTNTPLVPIPSPSDSSFVLLRPNTPSPSSCFALSSQPEPNQDRSRHGAKDNTRHTSEPRSKDRRELSGSSALLRVRRSETKGQALISERQVLRDGGIVALAVCDVEIFEVVLFSHTHTSVDSGIWGKRQERFQERV